jgi:hypothetical protein
MSSCTITFPRVSGTMLVSEAPVVTHVVGSVAERPVMKNCSVITSVVIPCSGFPLSMAMTMNL